MFEENQYQYLEDIDWLFIGTNLAILKKIFKDDLINEACFEETLVKIYPIVLTRRFSLFLYRLYHQYPLPSWK